MLVGLGPLARTRGEREAAVVMVLSTWLVADGEWEDMLLTYWAGWLVREYPDRMAFGLVSFYIHQSPRRSIVSSVQYPLSLGPATVGNQRVYLITSYALDSERPGTALTRTQY